MPPEADAGASAHYRALESLYARAPVNGLFQSRLEIVEQGFARIRFTVDEQVFHGRRANRAQHLAPVRFR